jgi:hypothetical protein
MARAGRAVIQKQRRLNMTDSITLFCNNMRQVNIASIDENDPRYVLYSVRVPSPRLDDDALIALENDHEFGAALAAWLAARARRVAKSRGVSA